jgi:hypothetical protein
MPGIRAVAKPSGVLSREMAVAAARATRAFQSATVAGAMAKLGSGGRAMIAAHACRKA